MISDKHILKVIKDKNIHQKHKICAQLIANSKQL